MLLQKGAMRRRRPFTAVAALSIAVILMAHTAHAEGFISASRGYTFGGDAGCRSATDCQDKNWNWGGSIGALGSFAGFEAELTHEGEFTGDRPNRTSVTTVMGNFLLAPRIAIVQPYGLAGIGAIRTRADVSAASQTQVGWSIGGGLLVFVQKHIGLKADVRHYHSFEKLDLLGVELAHDQSKIDFGRAAFGVLLKF
jgi:opacity protein-like surface antigen